MANMSYCRFENTYRDLKDCYEAISFEDKTNEIETKYKKWLIYLCQKIVDEARNQGLIDEE